MNDRDVRQAHVGQWVRATFGDHTMAIRERAQRLLEEAVELAQASGLSPDDARAIVGHVFSKPMGEPRQEAGGLGVCLLAYCEAAGFSADEEERREFERVQAIDPAHFQRRHNRKADAGIAVHVESTDSAPPTRRDGR